MSNTKYVTGVTVYNINCDDDIIYVDTSASPVSIVLPNIQNSGITLLTNKTFTINDYTNNASVNNIAIVASGNSVNSGQATAINSNNGSAFATIVGVNSWQVTTDNPITDGLVYMGTWNASINDPTLVSSVGIGGHYYIVSVAGTTNLNGVTDWNVGDWAVFVDGTTNAWQKVDNHDIQSYNFIQDDGNALPQQSVIDFQGAGVTASNGTGKTIVTIPIQPAYATVQEEGTSLTQRTILNFTGTGVTASDVGGKTQINIPATAYTRGNTLTVDSVYGNDTNAAANPNSTPFLTISAALLVATSGNNVIVNAGTYNEAITIPAGVCLTGATSQVVIIQKLGVIANTTLVNLNTGSRIENVTCNLSSAGNFNLTGVEFATGASITAKIRTSVWNITSTTVNGPTIIGALSSGVSATTFSSTDAIARSTINVISSSTGVSRGVYVNGANRFTIRETVIYARGTGLDIVGSECNNSSSVLEIRSSTVNGTLSDVKRTSGSMTIGATDLVNNTASGNSFTPTQAPASFSLGTINGLGTNRRYYMLTGTVPVGQLTNEAKTNAYDPLNALPIPVTQLSLIISVTMAYQPSLPVATSLTLNIYKNSILTPEISLTMLPSDAGIKKLDTQSFSLSTTDVMRVTLETTGNVGAGGAFQAVIGYY
jgi:hypothetical protein